MGQEHEPHAKPTNSIEAFWGVHQGGIVTPPQNHCYFAAFDLTTERRDDVVSCCEPGPTRPPGSNLRPDRPAAGRGCRCRRRRLGRGVRGCPVAADADIWFRPWFVHEAGQRPLRTGGARPDALVDLPRFNGDQLVAEKTGGDLSVQACADDPQVAFHAVRQLARLTYDTAQLRWAQTGFRSTPADGGTPRNLMGFKDGTQTPEQIDRAIWVGDEGPAWMRGGSYLVVRRIRMALEHWDRTEVSFQEQTIGRHKYSGAPLGSERRIRAAGPRAK